MEAGDDPVLGWKRGRSGAGKKRKAARDRIRGAGYHRTYFGKAKKSGRPVAVPRTDADRSVRKRSGGALGVYRSNRRYPETGVGKDKSDFGILDILFAFGKNL